MVGSKLVSVASLFTLLLVACPSYAGPTKLLDYPPRKVSDCAIKAEKSGLVVGIQPVEELSDQKSYFGSDLKQKGLIPVYVVIEDRSEGDSFLFDKSAVRVGVGAGAGTGNNVSSKSVETLQVVSALAISPVGMIIGAKLAKDEAQVQTNLVKKELQSKTLSPGGSASGFLYVSRPKVGTRDPIHLKIFVTRSGDDEPISLEFDF